MLHWLLGYINLAPCDFELPRQASLLFLMLFYRALVHVKFTVKLCARLRWMDYKLDTPSACLWLYLNYQVDYSRERDMN